MCNEETKKTGIRTIGRFVVIPVEIPYGGQAATEVCNQPVEPNGEDDSKPPADGTREHLGGRTEHSHGRTEHSHRRTEGRTEHSHGSTEHSAGTPVLRNCRTFYWKLLRCLFAALVILAYIAVLVLLWCTSCIEYNDKNFRGTLQFVATLIAPVVVYLVYIYCVRRREDEDE